ncbi:hypothetical protein Mapa_001123 [Marchantia paleacea]|nr:hypothetical protein Mapa_001123 [Marchantia paleacea]
MSNNLREGGREGGSSRTRMMGLSAPSVSIVVLKGAVMDMAFVDPIVSPRASRRRSKGTCSRELCVQNA